MGHAVSARITTALAIVLLVAASLGGQTRQNAPRDDGPRFGRVRPLPFPEEPHVFDTLGPRIRVVPFVAGLEDPWSIAFLPDGDLLVTEKPGRLRIVRDGALDPEPSQESPRSGRPARAGSWKSPCTPDFPRTGGST